jgi:hypothetical protein
MSKIRSLVTLAFLVVLGWGVWFAYDHKKTLDEVRNDARRQLYAGREVHSLPTSYQRRLADVSQESIRAYSLANVALSENEKWVSYSSLTTVVIMRVSKTTDTLVIKSVAFYDT